MNDTLEIGYQFYYNDCKKYIQRKLDANQKGIKEHNSDGENENKKENIAGLSEHMKETGYNPSLEYINIIRY